MFRYLCFSSIFPISFAGPFVLCGGGRTDHKNLVYLQTSVVPKVIRWRLRLMEFSFVVLHVPGDDNTVADLLSRAFSHQVSVEA
jgi:hypothetical protein